MFECNGPKCLLARAKQCLRHFETEKRKKRSNGKSISEDNKKRQRSHARLCNSNEIKKKNGSEENSSGVVVLEIETEQSIASHYFSDIDFSNAIDLLTFKHHRLLCEEIGLLEVGSPVVVLVAITHPFFGNCWKKIIYNCYAAGCVYRPYIMNGAFFFLFR